MANRPASASALAIDDDSRAALTTWILTLRAHPSAVTLLPAEVPNGHERKDERVAREGDQRRHRRCLIKHRRENSPYRGAAWRIPHDDLQRPTDLHRLNPQARQEKESEHEHPSDAGGHGLRRSQSDDNQAQREDLSNGECDGEDEERDVNGELRTEDRRTADNGDDDGHRSQHEVEDQLHAEKS